LFENPARWIELYLHESATYWEERISEARSVLTSARNVSEAVDLANAWKRDGKYDWFRGQTRNWTLSSSLARHPSESQSAQRRIQRFDTWVHNTPGLEALAAASDNVVAVAQHYGMLTHFIDFTTEPEVAGFFASEGVGSSDPGAFDVEKETHRFFASRPPLNTIGCILCLKRSELMETWQSVADMRPMPADAAPEFLELSVPNLWRLEAQHGVFLYCPISRFEEVVFDLDRIVFPHTGQIASPPRKLIYPERKSPLELLLDQYFLQERVSRLHVEQEKAGYRTTISSVFKMDAEREHTIPIDASWHNDRLEPWLQLNVESFWDSLSEIEWDIPFTLSTGAHEARDFIANSVAESLAAHPDSRRARIIWKSGDSAFDAAATLIWDGLRALPCSDTDLAVAIGNCGGLMVAARSSENDEDGNFVTQRYFGSPAIEVEFGTGDGGFSRAFVATNSVLAAFRDDLRDLLDEADQDLLRDSPGFLLLKILDPRRMFGFQRFASFFIREVVPSQTLWWREISVVYSPARVNAFGLP
jgi:hypothetical protein